MTRRLIKSLTEKDGIKKDIFTGWMSLCETQQKENDKDEEMNLSEEKKDEIKKFCFDLISKPKEYQLEFFLNLKDLLSHLYTYSMNRSLFNTIENGVFLKTYIPLFINSYDIEEAFPDFLYYISYKQDCIKIFHYFILASNEIFNSIFMKEKDEIEEDDKEFDDKKAISVYLIWNIHRNRNFLNNNQIDYLVKMTSKCFNYLSLLSDENTKNKEKEKEKSEEVKLNLLNSLNISEKERIMKRKRSKEELMNKIIHVLLGKEYFRKGREKEDVFKNKRINKELGKDLDKHLSLINSIIISGDEERIINHILSTPNQNFSSSLSSKISSSSFSYSLPFSFNTLYYIMIYRGLIFEDEENKKEEEKKEGIKNIISFLYSWMGLIWRINNIKIKEEEEEEEEKEEEEEIKEKEKENIKEENVNKLNINNKNADILLTSKELSELNNSENINWSYFFYSLSSIIKEINVMEWNEEWKKIFESIIIFPFLHSKLTITLKRDEEEKKELKKNLRIKEEEIKKEIKFESNIKPFILNSDKRKDFIKSGIFSYVNEGKEESSFFSFLFLKRKKGGCEYIGIITKVISGEIVDRENYNKESIKLSEKKKKRRLFEREINTTIWKHNSINFNSILSRLWNWKLKQKERRRKGEEITNEKEEEEFWNNMEDEIEEEDTRESFIPFLTYYKGVEFVKEWVRINFVSLDLRDYTIKILSLLNCPLSQLSPFWKEKEDETNDE